MASGPITPRMIDHLSGRDNNLNLIRVIAASAVLVSHAFPITLGAGAAEPLDKIAGVSLGWLAVAVFFSLSGLLIANSFERRKGWSQFVLARILRLFPALLAVLILTVVAGLALTSLSVAAYLASFETWTYVPRNLSLALLQYPLPGVFQDNAYPGAINGSLWTLFYEVMCYSLLFVAGLIGVLRSKWLVTALVAAIGAGFVYSLHIEPPAYGLATRLYSLVQLGFPFALGVLVFVWREKFSFDLRISGALWLIAAIMSGTLYAPLCFMLALVYWVGWFGFGPKGWLLEYNRLGDYSYGIYIYAFPLQQTMAFLFPELRPLANMALSIVPTVILAVLSWHLIEKRALAQIKPLAARIQPGIFEKVQA